LGAFVISFAFIPHYFRGDLFTAYQLIERRFGKKLAISDAGLSGYAGGRRRRPDFCGRDCSWYRPFQVSGLKFSDFGRDLAAIGIVTVLDA